MSQMGETIMLTVVLLLALYGCVELIRRIALRVLKPSGRYGGILVLPITGHCSDVEYLIRSATTQSRWSSDMADCILILDAGMDEETRQLAEEICMRYEGVRLDNAEAYERIFDENPGINT